MPTEALIDGHNALYALGLSEGEHEAARHTLLRRVEGRADRATVFFDARHHGRESGTSMRGIAVRYCGSREADAAILERVSNAHRASDLLVVTNDRELSGKCAQHGARVCRIDEFFSGPAPKKRGRRRARGAQGPSPRRDAGPPMRPEDFGLTDGPIKL